MINELKQLFSNDNKKKLGKVYIITFFVYLMAHGYRVFNNLYTADSLVSSFQDDILWERSLGRFMHIFTLIFRGTLCAPWLISFLSIVFLGMSAYILSQILDINKNYLLVLLVCVMACNESITTENACFFPWVDVYFVSLFFAVLSIWFLIKNTLWGYIGGIVSIVFSMGFYQAYIDVVMITLLFIFIIKLYKDNRLKETLISFGKVVLSVAIAGGLYFLLYKGVCLVHHVPEANSYNSLSGLGDFSEYSLFGLIINAYKQFFTFLFCPHTYVSTYLSGIVISNFVAVLIKISVVVLLAVLIFGIVINNVKRKSSTGSWVCQIILLLGMPLAGNMVYVLSKGVEHVLMAYSINMVLIFAIYEIQELGAQKEQVRPLPILATVPLLLLIWNNVVFSNQVYFKLDLEKQAALSLSTKLVHEIESIDGYQPGITEVCFLGCIEYSDYIMNVDYLTNIELYGTARTALTYSQSIKTYIKNYLGIAMNIDWNDYPGDCYDMPIYPEKGSVIMDENGRVLVRLSK